MNAPLYNKLNPFHASIKARYVLTKSGSKKKTQHLVLDLKGSGLVYKVGDSIGVFPQHHAELVAKTLQAIKATGKEEIQLKHTAESLSLLSFLTSKANITTITPKLAREVCARQVNPAKKVALEELLKEENRIAFKAYLGQFELWDFLEEQAEVNFTPQEIADLLSPLLPRLYSISSSPHHVGEEVHLTIAPFEYVSNGHKRYGVCTYYLAEMVPLHAPVVPVFVQPAHSFYLPEDPHIDLIMIGPGTGIAPFRAFLQERLLHHQVKSKHWLFFGEWNRAYDFFYEEEWLAFNQRGHLQLELAFSRDQDHKIYVQHKMWEKGQEIYQWLQNGAYLYVCGDSQRMAKDVEETLLKIIQEFGSCDGQQARDYVKQLRQQKRYLRDVY